MAYPSEVWLDDNVFANDGSNGCDDAHMHWILDDEGREPIIHNLEGNRCYICGGEEIRCLAKKSAVYPPTDTNSME
jgi:hypothetical protein